LENGAASQLFQPGGCQVLNRFGVKVVIRRRSLEFGERATLIAADVLNVQ
jgi:hypothetical protein